jgi:hypothetical protein
MRTGHCRVVASELSRYARKTTHYEQPQIAVEPHMSEAASGIHTDRSDRNEHCHFCRYFHDVHMMCEEYFARNRIGGRIELTPVSKNERIKKMWKRGL